MSNANKRKTSVEIQEEKIRRVENKILACMGRVLGTELANTMGVNSSQVTRWKGERGSKSHFVYKVAKLLVAIGYEEPDNNMLVIEGEEAANLAKAFSLLIGKVGSENAGANPEPLGC